MKFISGGKSAFVFFISLLYSFTCVSQNDRLWATYYGGASNDEGYSIATDSSGNVYLAGITSSPGAISFGGFQSIYNGSNDAFLVKFDANGNRIWATYYGGAGDDFAYCVTTDASGNIYMAGSTINTSGIASGGFQDTYGGGSADAFLVKFDPSGNRLWATYYGGAGNDQGYTVVTDASENVYVMGITYSSDMASGGFQNVLSNNNGSNDVFLVKFDAAGNRLWATYYGGSDEDYGLYIATDPSENVYLVGNTFSSNLISSGGFQNTYKGSGDAFLVKFNAAGNRLWATYYGGTGYDWGYGIATDASGNVFMGGTTNSASQIASGGFSNILNGSGGGTAYDGFLVKFNSAGNRIWATYYGGAADDFAYNVDTDGDSNVYLSGTTVSNSNIASGGFLNTTTAGSVDAFMVKFDAAGNRTCATYYGGPDYDYGYSLNADNSGNIFLAGNTPSISKIASGGFQNSYGGGTFDAFLVKFTSCLSTPISERENSFPFKIYPNPSNGIFQLVGTDMADNENVVEIYNIIGEKIMGSIIKNDWLTINLSDQAPGIYFLNIKTESEVFTQKIIIQD
jgi:hypothetical protein